MEVYETLPIVPLRDVVVFPHMMMPFVIGRPSSTRALEHKVQMAKKQSTMSAPSMAKRITTTGLAKVSLPEMPAMPKLAAPPVKMAGAGGVDVSFNPGGMATSSGLQLRAGDR